MSEQAAEVRGPIPGPVWIIYNPTAGRGRGAGVAREAASRLTARGCEVTCRESERPRHGCELAAAAAAAGAARVAVVGGDGTVRDVVAGLAGARLPVAVLPAGTGNDLARTLHLPRRLDPALEVLLHGVARRLDVWLWNEVAFVNVAGLGLDAAVADTVNRRLRGVRVTLAYLLGVALTLPGFQPLALQLESEAWSYSGSVMLAAAANARYYGGGMRIAPQARPDDGELAIVVVEAVPRLELARQLPSVFRGRHVDHPRVKTFSAARLRVDAPAGQPVTLDGELLGTVPAIVERAPYSALFMVGRDAPGNGG